MDNRGSDADSNNNNVSTKTSTRASHCAYGWLVVYVFFCTRASARNIFFLVRRLATEAMALQTIVPMLWVPTRFHRNTCFILHLQSMRNVRGILQRNTKYNAIDEFVPLLFPFSGAVIFAVEILLSRLVGYFFCL